MDLRTPLSAVLRTTKDHITALKELGITTVEDLLWYLPRTHEDRSSLQTLHSAPLGEKVSIRGTVNALKLVRTKRGKKLVKGTFVDTEGGQAEVVWFNQPHIKRMLSEGDEVVMTGKLIEKGYRLQIQSPQFEHAERRELLHAGRLVPVYPQHNMIHTKWLREKMALVRPAIARVPETLPQEVVRQEGLLSRAEALESLHFPESPEDVRRARERFAFEEMYATQLDALRRRKQWKANRQKRLETPMDITLMKAFFSSLSFQPTDSQKVAIYEILRDMERAEPMSRLLEGDVGSGKTLVATAVIANVLRHGGQCAFMAPTEVLARQHAQTLANLLLRAHTHVQQALPACDWQQPSVVFLTGSVPAAEAQERKRALHQRTADVVVGTHALIEEDVCFADLRLVVVDEQHRFGVVQRERLREKGSPHFLSMTATPIPRTLALTSHGQHDLSVLKEKPGRRQTIRTSVVPPGERRTVEQFMDTQIEEGRQIFVICPLITSSEAEEMRDVQSVEAEVDRLRERFPRRRIAQLHGKMTPAEKEEVMRAFREREFDFLVSTSVVEVGIDVPNASVMFIEGAERFGLAQLHQFRGRVGRGEHRSFCFLATSTPEQAESPRLKAMEEQHCGFKLSEIDLQLRGPGDLFGVRQSGMPEAFIQGLLNPELVVRARRAAEATLSQAGEQADARTVWEAS